MRVDSKSTAGRGQGNITALNLERSLVQGGGRSQDREQAGVVRDGVRDRDRGTGVSRHGQRAIGCRQRHRARALDGGRGTDRRVRGGGADGNRVGAREGRGSCASDLRDTEVDAAQEVDVVGRGRERRAAGERKAAQRRKRRRRVERHGVTRNSDGLRSHDRERRVADGRAVAANGRGRGSDRERTGNVARLQRDERRRGGSRADERRGAGGGEHHVTGRDEVTRRTGDRHGGLAAATVRHANTAGGAERDIVGGRDRNGTAARRELDVERANIDQVSGLHRDGSEQRLDNQILL